MSILAMCGFERRSLVAEGITQESVSAGAYETFVNGLGSTRSFSITANDVKLTKPLKNSSDELWIHARIYFDNVPGMRFGARAGTDKGIYLETDDDQKLIIRTGAGNTPSETTLDTGSTILGNDQWYNFHIHLKLDVAGFFRGYINGNINSPEVEYEGDTTDIMDESFTHLFMGGDPNLYIDDVVVMDPSDATGTVDVNKIINPVIAVIMPNDDGTKAEQASGTYADVDELPPSGSDFVRLDAIDEDVTFVGAPASGMAQILANNVWSRIFRNDDAAGESVELQIFDPNTVTTVYSDVLPAPSDGAVEWIFEEDANGDPYDQAQFNATEFGIRSST